jgi:hypothetical protein
MLQFDLDWKSSASYFHVIKCYDEYEEKEIDIQHLIRKDYHELSEVVRDMVLDPNKVDYEEV